MRFASIPAVRPRAGPGFVALSRPATWATFLGLMQVEYHYPSPVGVLWIARDPHDHAQVWLGIDETPLGPYSSPEAAAEAVRAHRSGWHPLDELHHSHRPETLSAWQAGPVPTP